MPSEEIKQKTTPEEKIMAVLNKMEIGDAVDLWRVVGDKLHLRIEQTQNILSDFKKKLPSKEV